MNSRKIIRAFFILTACLITKRDVLYAQAATSYLVKMSYLTIPAGAIVSVDGNAVGITPLNNSELSPGMHHFAISLTGFPVWRGDYAVFGKTNGFGIDFTDKAASLQLSKTERNPSFVNFLASVVDLDWWASDANSLHFVSYENLTTSSRAAYLYTYHLTSQQVETDAPPENALQDAHIRRQFNLPVRDGNDIFTVAYTSPSGRYILHTQHIDASTFTFVVTDTKLNRSFATDFKIDTAQTDGHYDETSFYPVWSPDEQTIWLNQLAHNSDPTIFFLQNGKVQTLHLTGFNNGTALDNGGMYTRPSDRGYALVWGNTYDSTGLSSPRAPYLLNLHTLIGTSLPIPDGDIVNVKAMLFSSDGKWIYVGTKEGITRINVQNLNDIELVSDAVSQAEGYQVIDMSYTLDYALVKAPGPNLQYAFYKIPKMQ